MSVHPSTTEKISISLRPGLGLRSPIVECKNSFKKFSLKNSFKKIPLKNSLTKNFVFACRLCFFHFNFFGHTLKSRCYFVYDVVAIVHVPLLALHCAVYRSWCVNGHEPIHGD